MDGVAGDRHWGGYVLCERCELCKAVESQTCTSETNNTLYVKEKKIAGREK